MFLYLYVLAAVIAVLGIIATFRSTLDNMLADPDQFSVYLNRFFIKVSMVEMLPIAMVILGYVFSPAEQLKISDAFIPIIIVALFMIIDIFYIFSQRSPAGEVGKELKQRIQSFILIAIALANAIPVIAIVFILVTVSPSG
ncbi:hypothetical protein [Oceanobacillus timonensis]|uniref:hypothetical protein n=1 Tax=Oceanobacillus timonensis TaxID=1926285 RepID=UPI0009B9E50E|nr:hypothetical protein [Oceanobacillus timonensis]